MDYQRCLVSLPLLHITFQYLSQINVLNTRHLPVVFPMLWLIQNGGQIGGSHCEGMGRDGGIDGVT